MDIGDYHLLTPENPNPTTLNKAIQIVKGLDGEGVVAFDYYLRDGLNKRYIYNFINPYSALETYINPPYLAITKQFSRKHSNKHEMILDALLENAKVKQVHESFGSITKTDYWNIKRPVLAEINRYYCEELFGEKMVLYTEENGIRFDLHTRYFPRDIEVGIIILSSTRALLEKALDSLMFNTFKENTKIYVGWCGEKMVYREILKKYGDIIHQSFWPLEQNGKFNFAKIHNKIIMDSNICTPDYFILMNDDVEIINHNFIQEMLYIAYREKAAIIGAALCFPEKDYKKRTYQHAGVFLSDQVRLFEHFARKKLVKKNYVPTREVSAVTFALVMIQAQVYHKLLLDNKFYGDCNDIDFCLRAREAGYKIWYSSKAEAWHVEAATRKEDPAMQNDLNSREYYKENYDRLKKAFTFS